MRFRDLYLKKRDDIKRWFNKENEEKKDVKKVGAVLFIFSAIIFGALYALSENSAQAKRQNGNARVETVDLKTQNIEDKYARDQVIPMSMTNRKIQAEESTPKTNLAKQDEIKLAHRSTHSPSRNIISHPKTNMQERERKYQTKAIVFDESGREKALLEEGTLIPAILISTIVMKDTKAPARLKIAEDIYDDEGKLIIPKDSTAIGSFGGFNDQGRAFGKTKKIKIIGEKIKTIECEILSSDESYGLAGIYYSEEGKYIAGSLITTFIGSFAEGFKTSVLAEMGDKLTKYSQGNLKNALFNALEKTALTEASREAQKLKDVKPFIVIPQGTPALLMVGNTMEM